MSGSVEAIWLKRVSRGPMDAVERSRAVAGCGLEGNANQGGARQVTLIERRAWEAAAAETGEPALDPRVRRANLLVSGVELADSRGRVLRLGPVRVRIRGATRPCRLMDELRPGLQAALGVEWRGGVYGEVLDDGEIVLGDPVSWSDDGV